jgi:hypothetical protein
MGKHYLTIIFGGINICSNLIILILKLKHIKIHM